MYKIPIKIKEIVGDMPYTLNDVGMSNSKVLIYDKYVLKIQNKSIETRNERDILECLNGIIPIPKLYCYIEDDNIAYTLMSRAKGEMLCSKKYLENPMQVIDIVAKGLKMLWSIDPLNIPSGASNLDSRLEVAKNNVLNNLVDLENAEEGTFGPNGFKNPEELLTWLIENKPKEDIVLTHGDMCLPNIFASGDNITSFIDLGKMGLADRWQDIAIAIRSLDHNFSGYYTGIKTFDFKKEMLLEKLGISFDEEKYKYYILLDELF